MKLKKYKSKRVFSQTPEPPPKLFKRKKGALQFVIQKHAASHLHYDFRIEVDGVLKSWAIPKGPSIDPKIKRLAIQVEDHPYSYKDFEGVIPEGYGAGTVMIWDQGHYSVDGLPPQESEALVREGLKKGEIRILLEGEKLKGLFSLVRVSIDDEDNKWLFIKNKDFFAKDVDITQFDQSAISNRTMEQIRQSF